MNGKCHACGGLLTVRAIEHVTMVANYRVTDGRTHVPVCSACGAADLSFADLQGYELRAALVVLNDISPVPGGAIKFARKAMGFTQKELGVCLDTRHETISGWEHEEAVPAWVALAMKGLLMAFIHEGKTKDDILKAASEPKVGSGHELRVA